MIRFPCPLCGQPLKVPDDQAGTAVICPRCEERSKVPSDLAVHRSPPDRLPARAAGQVRSALLGRSGWLRGAVALAGGAGILSLVLAVGTPVPGVLQDFAATARSNALVVFPASLVVFLVLMYALVTSCPACGKWWARAEGETAYLGRNVVEQHGVRRVRSTRQTTYYCKFCGHSWSMTSTDEY